MIHDLELERRTRTKIESDVVLNVAIDVTAKAVNSAARVCRVVTSEALRDGAIKPAKSIRSGLTINDRIGVKCAAWLARQE